MNVNWCTGCKVVLANEEVVNGVCERCGAPVVHREKSQWMLKITAYADRLIDGLDGLDYIDRVVTQQKNWIGRSHGAEVNFTTTSGDTLTVYTTRCDTLFGATYMVVSPEHALINEWLEKGIIKNADEVKAYQLEASRKSDMERTELNKNKTGVRLDGVMGINPVNDTEIPIFISDYVLASYGTGAIMAVPAHDTRDWEFAKKFGLPIIEVVKGNTPSNLDEAAFTDVATGTLVNSGFLNGLSVNDAKAKMVKWLKKTAKAVIKSTLNCVTGSSAVSVTGANPSRWSSVKNAAGSRFRKVNCRSVCRKSPTLSRARTAKARLHGILTGSIPPARAAAVLLNVKPILCRSGLALPGTSCGIWTRTMTRLLPAKKRLSTGDRFDWYNGGMEHTTLHLLYSRFWHNFLYDIGVVPYSEPYKKRTSHGMILGLNPHSFQNLPAAEQKKLVEEYGSEKAAKEALVEKYGEMANHPVVKMSKSLATSSTPMISSRDYGADTMRTYEMFMGDFEQSAPWNTSSIAGCKRFLDRIWKLQDCVIDGDSYRPELEVSFNQTIKKVSEDIETLKYNTAIAAMMGLLNKIEGIGSINRKEYRDLLIMLTRLLRISPRNCLRSWASVRRSLLSTGSPMILTSAPSLPLRLRFRSAARFVQN